MAVVIERHFARTFSGKSSPVTTQATGPQELATMEQLAVLISLTSGNLTEEDVNAHEGDRSLLCSNIGRASNSTRDCHNELTNTHPDGTHKQ